MEPSEADVRAHIARPTLIKRAEANSLVAVVTAWFCALAAMATTLVGKWFEFPISKQLVGVHYSLLPSSPGDQPFVPWSFGGAAALLLFVGACAFSLRRWLALAWVGALLLWLALFGGLKPVLTDARLLQTVGTEFDQQQLAIEFARHTLPVNLGADPTLLRQLDLGSIEARLVAGWYFVHIGWWAALIPGLLALGYSTARSRSTAISWIAAGGSVMLFCACALGPILAELTLMRAHRLEAQGEYDDAVHVYRQAMALDSWQAHNLGNYAAIGGLDAARGKRNTPEFHVYHAELPSTQVDLLVAATELHAALPYARPGLAEIIRAREAELYAQYARSLHASGACGAAATAAENALERDPGSLLAAYYFSRDAYLSGRYSDSLTLSMRLLKRVGDPTMRANILGNIGDAYTQLGDHVSAKLAYRNSYRDDYLLNLRALSALNGPGAELQ